MKKIKEYFKKNNERICKSLIMVWLFHCIVFILSLSFFYIIKEQTIIESIINAYFSLRHVLFITMKVVACVGFFVITFFIPSALLWNFLIISYQKSEEEQYENRRSNSINN